MLLLEDLLRQLQKVFHDNLILKFNQVEAIASNQKESEKKLQQAKTDLSYATNQVENLENHVTNLKAENHKLVEEKSLPKRDYSRTKKESCIST